MANVFVEESSLQDIADAIRSKNGTQNTYKPSQMADAITDLPSGGITPTGTVNITTNGTHDVTNYESASVNVPTGTTPTGTKQISITQNGTITEDVTNYANAEITVNVSGADYPNYRSIITRSFSGAFIDNEITSIGRVALAFSTGITSIHCANVTSCGNEAFRNCSALTTVVLPKCTSLAQSAGTTCANLKSVDILGSSSAGLNAAQIFASSTVLDTLIIRANNVSKLNNINVFTNTPFASGNTGGTLYVPSALIASYQSATNWSTILGYETNSIQAIEGSIYETQYADGTSIPS